MGPASIVQLVLAGGCVGRTVRRQPAERKKTNVRELRLESRDVRDGVVPGYHYLEQWGIFLSLKSR